MSSKSNPVPKLRFPEFRGAGEWVVKAFDDVLDSVSSKKFQIPKSEKNELGSYRVIDQGQNYIAGYSDDQSKVFTDPPVIIFGDHTVILKYVDFNFVVGGDGTKILRNISDHLQYLYYFLLINNVKSEGYKRHFSILRNISFILPCMREQQKIANCLSSLDDLITAETQKLDGLKSHKKGLMQQLFPAEGETQPKLRFPEFLKVGKWEGKAISELTPLDKKYGIVDGPFGSNLKSIHYQTEGIPIITSGFVTEGFFCSKNYLFVTKEKFEKENRSAVQGGDIVMAKIGARCGASAIMPINHETGILSGNALKISVDEERYSTVFIWQQLWHLYQNKKLDVLKNIGAQPAISMASLKKFEFSLPQKKEEQQKIADCLSSLDDLITAETQKLDGLKSHKKGLMQKLFPATDEVNG